MTPKNTHTEFSSRKADEETEINTTAINEVVDTSIFSLRDMRDPVNTPSWFLALFFLVSLLSIIIVAGSIAFILI